MLMNSHFQALRLAVFLSVFAYVMRQSVVAADHMETNRSVTELSQLRKDVAALSDDVRRLNDLLAKRVASSDRPIASSRTNKTRVPLAVQNPVEAEVHKTLLKPVTLDFQDAKLRDVLVQIRRTININLAVDESSLAEEGRSMTDLISIQVSEISARSALKLVLEPLGLTYIVQDEVVVVTNRVRAKGELVQVTYPVAHIFPVPPDQKSTEATLPEKNGAALMGLRELILKTISPDSWEECGGKGSIKVFPTTDGLVVRQTKDVHAEIVDLLQQIERLQRIPQNAAITEDRQMIEKYYDVTDLVTPIPNEMGKRTKARTSDWLKLINRVTAAVEPENWVRNGGNCSIGVARENQLLVYASSDVQDAIAQFLKELRNELNLQVRVAVTFLSVPTDAQLLKRAGRKLEFDPRTDMSLIDDVVAELLMAEHVKTQKGILSLPEINMFDGQIANTGFSVRVGDERPKLQLQIRGKVSEDRRSVRLDVSLNAASLINDLVNNSYIVRDGGYLLVDITKRIEVARESATENDLNSASKQDQTNSGSPEMKSDTFVLIQPRIIVPEEIEERFEAPSEK